MSHDNAVPTGNATYTAVGDTPPISPTVASPDQNQDNVRLPAVSKLQCTAHSADEQALEVAVPEKMGLLFVVVKS